MAAQVKGKARWELIDLKEAGGDSGGGEGGAEGSG